jgi:hypothetical protein
MFERAPVKAGALALAYLGDIDCRRQTVDATMTALANADEAIADLRALLAERDEALAQVAALKAALERAGRTLERIGDADVPPGHVCYATKAAMAADAREALRACGGGQ